MLVSLPDGWWSFRNPVTEIMAGPGYVPEELASGVYLTHHNFNHDIRHLIVEEYPFQPVRHGLSGEELSEFVKRISDPDYPEDFGVCDTWEQIVHRWPVIATDPRQFVISLSEVRREDQPDSGGWRWHKWGTYIGEHDPQYEYLADEDPSIERVLCFHIFEVEVP